MITILGEYEDEYAAPMPIKHIRVCVDTLNELLEVVKQHGDAWETFEGLPNGLETDEECIGEQPCNDGVHVVFYAPDAETARKIWDEMF